MFWDWIPKGEPLEWVDKKIPTEHGYNLTKKNYRCIRGELKTSVAKPSEGKTTTAVWGLRVKGLLVN
jgi:hypothetical protein